MSTKFLVFIILALATSCSTLKRATTPTGSSSHSKKGNSPFIETIAIKPDVEKDVPTKVVRINSGFDMSKAPASSASSIEVAGALQFKYSILMNLPVEELGDSRIYEFLEEWYGTPYRYGGNTKSGIDCSAFTCYMLSTLFSVALPRTSREQFSISMKIDKDQMTIGDLVFFKNRSSISHVGVYLGNNKFAHAATSGGVMISDLDEQYFAKRYAGAGRVIHLAALQQGSTSMSGSR